MNAGRRTCVGRDVLCQRSVSATTSRLSSVCVCSRAVHGRAITIHFAFQARLDVLEHLRIRQLQQFARVDTAALDARSVLRNDSFGDRQRPAICSCERRAVNLWRIRSGIMCMVSARVGIASPGNK